jgi:hypothetical protein
MTAIAVMQPYFFPYAGYFRLFAAADIFVAYDCVQFPRRGWVHRNRLPDAAGRPAWLTLPLEKAPREAKIRDLRFAADAPDRLIAQLRRFPALDGDQPALTALRGLAPVDYLLRGLGEVCAALGIARTVVRSSSLVIPAELRGEARILAICEALGATRYINAPGGAALYDERAFARRGIALDILAPHRGPSWSMLHRLQSESAGDLKREIESQV